MNQKQDKVDVTIPIIHPDEWIDKTQIFSIDACTNNSNDGSNNTFREINDYSATKEQGLSKQGRLEHDKNDEVTKKEVLI